MNSTDKLALVDNMRRYGGCFVNRLADAMLAADPTNYKRLCAAFPEIVSRYSEAQVQQSVTIDL